MSREPKPRGRSLAAKLRLGLLVTVLTVGCFHDEKCNVENFPCLLCPGEVGPPPPTPWVVFVGWDARTETECHGIIQNIGNATALNVRVEVNYCDSVRVVRPTIQFGPVQNYFLAPGAQASFVTPPQGTPSGYPPIARITWNGGAQGYQLPARVEFRGWIALDASVAVGSLWNTGGDTADSVQVHALTRSGLHVYRTRQLDNTLPVGWYTEFEAEPRDSAGVVVYPQILDITWISHRCEPSPPIKLRASR